MANDDAKEALLPRTQEDVSYQLISEKNAPQRRRYHSGASVEINQQQQQNGPQPNSISADQLSFRKVLMFLSAYLGIGAISFFLVRNQIKGTKTNGLLDAIYFCVVTMTTVGYGDLVPDSMLAKILACIFVFTGMALVGFVLSKAADYIVEKEEILIVKAIHMHEKCGSTEILKEAETNKARYKFLTTLALILLLIIVGTFFLHQVEGLSLFDAFYGVCATITTLGYGDKSFSTKWGRLFAIFWILISTISLAQLLLYLAELHTEKRRRSLINWVLKRKMTVADLEAADLDHDNAVSLAEFVVHKLKEMEKISEEDVSIVVEIFKKLDVDHSGNLTASDLVISQSSQSQ